ncbi:DapH/DapD/GlmU-related protein [Persicobacter sp. CCB-QB2]|uniref:acyltransferase n=1 Tax=Persicobacter sp. CCB-QB2 TaxID=1561025 RepID=UPI0006A9C6B8|nr:acyltransferase [Persicobacter sp. CCB-QB2]
MRVVNNFWRLYIKFRFLFIPDGAFGDRARGKVYEPFLQSYGKNFKVGSNAFIYNPNGLSVGDHVYIGFNSYLGQGEVHLADEVLIGNFVSITASNHLRKGNSFRFGGFEPKKINIGKGTWIAAHSSITAGVEIGEGSLVAAGSVVTKSFGDSLVIGGVPAVVIKEMNDEFLKAKD